MSTECYIAARDLYDGANVVFREGEKVPADAYPQAAIESLLGNGGLRRFRAEYSRGERQLITTVPPAETAGASPVDLHQVNSEDARSFVATVTDAEQLGRLEERERAHPKYDGGRTGVLNAIEAQRQRLLEGEGG